MLPVEALTSKYAHGYQTSYHKSLLSRRHRHSFFAHRDCFGGSDISNDDIFELPFSISLLLVLGVGGTSSIFVKPLLDLLELRTFCTSFGNVDLLGVNAVATLLADLRIVFLTSHDRFLARYQRIDDATTRILALFLRFGDVWEAYFQEPQRRPQR